MSDWKMDRWKYYDVTHRCHVLCNPTSLAKLDDVISLLDLKPDARVVDIACGKGELLARLAERYGVAGVGVDPSPFCIADAKTRLQRRAPRAKMEFVQMDGAKYRPEPPESFDLASCVGASWVFGGHRGTLRALKGMAYESLYPPPEVRGMMPPPSEGGVPSVLGWPYRTRPAATMTARTRIMRPNKS